MPTANHDGLELYYETGGTSGGDAVVFVEGWGLGRWMWNWQRRAVGRAFETILPDNRGTGRSDVPEGPRTNGELFYRQALGFWSDWLTAWCPPLSLSPWVRGVEQTRTPFTVSDMAADLEAVLADHGVKEVHVVGASMGGMIAQQYALEYDRAKTLTLMCTTPGGEDAVLPSPDVQRQMFDVHRDRSAREATRHKLRAAMSEEFLADNDALVERIVDWRLEEDASREGRLAQAAAVGSFGVGDRLDEIDVPTLVMHGTGDRVLPEENADRLHEGLPDSELVLLEDAPHMFFVERAETVNEHLLAFLREHGTTAGPEPADRQVPKGAGAQ